MKTKRFQQVWLAVVGVAVCRCAGAQPVTVASSSVLSNNFGGHPLISAFAHIVFLSVLLGAGSTIVAVLFKPPFRE